jgi:hypothetical protein
MSPGPWFLRQGDIGGRAVGAVHPQRRATREINGRCEIDEIPHMSFFKTLGLSTDAPWTGRPRKVDCRRALENRVNERSHYRSGSKNYHSAEQQQPHDDRKEPEFFRSLINDHISIKNSPIMPPTRITVSLRGRNLGHTSFVESYELQRHQEARHL